MTVDFASVKSTGNSSSVVDRAGGFFAGRGRRVDDLPWCIGGAEERRPYFDFDNGDKRIAGTPSCVEGDRQIDRGDHSKLCVASGNTTHRKPWEARHPSTLR